MALQYSLVFLVAVFVSTATRSLDPETMTTEEITAFLEKYGYLLKDCETDITKDMSEDDRREWAFKSYQGNMGIPQTGWADNETISWMRKPRCGVPDIRCQEGPATKRRRKRFATGQFRWGADPIRYKILNYTSDLAQDDVERIMGDALQLWSGAANLNFQRVDADEGAIIEIFFAFGEHGDGAPFDGVGRTLAHAFLPSSSPIAGDAHFDDAEPYTDGVDTGINLYFVAVHEFGHSLGLQHSTFQDAIMFPTYLGFKENLQLHSDDIAGIRQLYGERPTPSPAPARTTRLAPTVVPTPSPSVGGVPHARFCENGRVDAIVTMGGVMYAFQGDNYARLDRITGIEEGFPRPITDWSMLNGSVDAILEDFLGTHSYFFQGSNVYLYNVVNETVLPELAENYPQPIAQVFPDLAPGNLNMALRWSNRAYLFKDDNYYLLDTRDRVRGDNPRPFSQWSLPDQTYTAAFRAINDKTYFFYGNQYLRFNDTLLIPDEGYPQSIPARWFGCTGERSELDDSPVTDPVTEPATTTEVPEMGASNRGNALVSAPITATATLVCAVLFMGFYR